MKKILVIALVLSFLGGFAIGGNTPEPVDASTDQQVGVGLVRFGNATVTQSPVRVEIDDRPVANFVIDLVGYFNFNSGEHTVVFRTEDGGTELARTTFNLEVAERVTVLLVGSGSSTQVVVVNDDNDPTIRGNTRVQVVNAIVGSGGLDASFAGQGLGNVAYGEVSDRIDLAAGSYDVNLGDTSFEAVATPNRYFLYVFVAADANSAPRLRTFIGRPYRVSGFNQFRFMNLVEAPEGDENPIYSVYVNTDEIPVYQNVDFGQATNPVTVQPATYAFQVYNQGEELGSVEPVATIDLEIAEDQSLFIIATGEPGDVSLNIFSDNINSVPVNTARLQVINLTTAISDFGVSGPHGEIVGQVPFGTKVDTQIPGGLYNLGLFTPGSVDAQIGRAEVNAQAGNLSTLVVYGSDRQRWLWFNQGLPQTAAMRVVHASRGAGDVDIYLNGEAVLTNFSYLDSTDYLSLEPGTYNLQIFPAGTDITVEGATPIWSDNYTLTGSSLAFTFVALGDDEVRINNYADNLELVPTGQSRIRFVNGVVGVEQVNFVNAANGGTFAAGVFFGQGTDNFNVDANTRTFNINETGVGTFYRIESFVLTPGVNYTYIVVGEGTDPENVDLIVLER